MAQDDTRPEYIERTQQCEIDGCRSRKYYWQGGFLICKQCGYQHPERQFVNEREDLADRGPKSTLKRPRPEKVSEIRRGASALLLYLQAYQVILWKQCHVLIQELGFPTRLEPVIKDLWALRLQLLNDRLENNEHQPEAIFSSQLAEEDETGSTRKSTARWKGTHPPTLIESLALCYLGCISLRLPLSIGELHRYAVREDVPFIRAIRFIPAALKKGMPAEYIRALDITGPLAPDHLRNSIHGLALLYQHHFDLGLAPLNFPLLLYKHVRNLALPLDVYQATLQIAKLLDIDFKFPSTKGRQQVSHLPEIALISLITIATKLFYPFSTQEFVVSEPGSPGRLALEWKVWVQAQQNHESRLVDKEHLARGTELDITERDAMTMTGGQLDEYLDWYERTWVDQERAKQKPHGIPKQILDMFPVGRRDGSHPQPHSFKDQNQKEQKSKLDQVQETMRNLTMRKTSGDDGADGESSAPRPLGSSYKRYRTVEDLTPYAQAFHGCAAMSIATKLETLLTAVLQIESRLLAWRERDIKEAGEDGSDAGVGSRADGYSNARRMSAGENSSDDGN